MNWKGNKIAIVGDIMADHYLTGSVSRISPEAPVIILDEEEDFYVPGGAANAAANVAALGGKALLYGVIGKDVAGEILNEKLASLEIDYSGVVIDGMRKTTRKTRVVSQKHQLLRLDRESRVPISAGIECKIIDSIAQARPSLILVSDYAKGVVTPGLISGISQIAREQNIDFIADPKPAHADYFKWAYLITPNKKEAQEMTGINFSRGERGAIAEAGRSLMGRLSTNVLITLGEEGMVLFEGEREPYWVETVAKDVSDVSGAGDTVIATISLGLSYGLGLKKSVNLANLAAGIKVGKFGTAPVSYSELMQRVSSSILDNKER